LTAHLFCELDEALGERDSVAHVNHLNAVGVAVFGRAGKADLGAVVLRAVAILG
jgi:hypothetical protein